MNPGRPSAGRRLRGAPAPISVSGIGPAVINEPAGHDLATWRLRTARLDRRHGPTGRRKRLKTSVTGNPRRRLLCLPPKQQFHHRQALASTGRANALGHVGFFLASPPRVGERVRRVGKRPPPPRSGCRRTVRSLDDISEGGLQAFHHRAQSRLGPYHGDRFHVDVLRATADIGFASEPLHWWPVARTCQGLVIPRA